MQTILKIRGMSCEACVGHIERALQAVPGVERADVNLTTAIALVEHNETAAVSQIIEAVVEDGYSADVV